MERIDDYNFELPDELIAKEALADRTASRLLVLDRKSKSVIHRSICDLPSLLQPGDLLILNDTRVLPARIFGFRTKTGGKWEGLFVGTTPDGKWRIIGTTRGKLQPGESITLRPAHENRGDGSTVMTLLEREPDEGVWIAEIDSNEPPHVLLEQIGTMPLPPYIGRKLAADSDWDRYQTSYAKQPGAIAAPTAGLHFTPELLAECQQKGIEHEFVTLHVGIGTFRPISVQRLDEHRMHSEWCELPPKAADAINRTRAAGGRVIAVGTTSVRTLESAAADCDGSFTAWSGDTELFIRPPYDFKVVDCLLTNFHLPKSSLLVLVSALAGVDEIKAAYADAIAQRYRFFSYGDAMLIL